MLSLFQVSKNIVAKYRSVVAKMLLWICLFWLMQRSEAAADLARGKCGPSLISTRSKVKDRIHVLFTTLACR